VPAATVNAPPFFQSLEASAPQSSSDWNFRAVRGDRNEGTTKSHEVSMIWIHRIEDFQQDN
jgi:hypothetical protein